MSNKTDSKKKSKRLSKIEGVSIRKAKNKTGKGFVIDENHDDYEDNQTHVATTSKDMMKLVDSLLK